MCLTEPHTSFKISGTKMFITCGEHDLTEDTILLALVKQSDALAGLKDISLSIVPKVMVNADTLLGAKNSLAAALLT